jgi:hypothetical protein
MPVKHAHAFTRFGFGSRGVPPLLVPHDGEDAPVVVAAEIRLERLCVADDRRLTRIKGPEGMEPAVQVGVIHDHDAAVVQSTPCMLQLEQDISLGVSAVVDEKVDLPELGQQTGQAAPARPMYVRPSIAQAFGYSAADLTVEPRIQWGRKVDAPEPAATVSRESFESKPGRNAASDPRLDDLRRPQMTR